jgi:predicted TIM-barrel fold metal-dependent hydrolase
MKRNVWYVVEPRERAINSMMDEIGEEHFLWGSDYPHIDSSADALSQILGSVQALSEHRQELVLGENARRLYQLDV